MSGTSKEQLETFFAAFGQARLAESGIQKVKSLAQPHEVSAKVLDDGMASGKAVAALLPSLAVLEASAHCGNSIRGKANAEKISDEMRPYFVYHLGTKLKD